MIRMGHATAVELVEVEERRHIETKLTASDLAETACLELALRSLDDLVEGLLCQRNPIQVKIPLVSFASEELALPLVVVDLALKSQPKHYSLSVVHCHLQTNLAEGLF
jgi:hypothetical protein